MSIFPRHVRPSNRVTFHCRIAQTPGSVAVSHRVFKGVVTDPDGRETVVLDRPLLLAPFTPGAEDGAQPLHHLLHDGPDDAFVEAMVREAALRVGLEATGPAELLAAMGELGLLRLGRADLERILQQLLLLRISTHFYCHYDVPAGGPLGRYRFEFGSVVAGRTGISDTLANDYFLVEELEVRGSRREGAGGSALVHNPSREPVLAKLVEIDGLPGARRSRATVHTLPPRRSTSMAFATPTAFLTYAEGTEWVYLGDPDDPPPLRNPLVEGACDLDDRVTLRVPAKLARYFAADVPGAGGVLVTRLLANDAVVLDTDESAVWLAADGFTPRSVVTAGRADAYEALSAAGLVRELR